MSNPKSLRRSLGAARGWATRRAKRAVPAACSPKPTEHSGGLEREAFAWWRAFAKPIHAEMVKRGIRKLVLERKPDGRVAFELDPEDGDPTDAVMKPKENSVLSEPSS